VADLVQPEILRAEFWIVGLVGAAAAIEDLTRRTISNWLSLAALAGGFACQFWAFGWRGALAAAAGTLAGFGVFLIFYLLGGMGGGDVKLMAGFGALLGAGRLLHAAFWTALVGGILAAIVVAADALVTRNRASRTSGKPTLARPLFIPYAPAIVGGVWLALLSSR
jgi:prepilin peptidase CpaA